MVDGFNKFTNVEINADICEYFKRWRINAIVIGTGNIIQNFERNINYREYEGDIIFKIDKQRNVMIIEIIDWDDEKQDWIIPIFMGDKIFVKEETLEVLINVLDGIEIKFDSLSGYEKALSYLYLVSNNDEYKYLIDNESILSQFEKIEIKDLENVQKVFCEYFAKDCIKNLNAGIANVTEFETEEAVNNSVGRITLGVCINEGIGGKSIEYAKAISTSQYISLHIKLENDGNILWEYFDTITDSMRVLCKKDSQEIYIENEYGVAINIKFELCQEYENALAYIMLASMKKDYSYLKNNKDINVSQEKNNEESPYDKLEKLVGLEEIKSDVTNLVNLMKMQIRRKNQGLKMIPISLHLVFSGNPGTGKTTVARILADIYKDIGILSKGHLVEVDRSNLVAGYVGQTAIKTQEKINEALGGILFIDEAYTLSKDENDYGQEAIDTILKAMEDHRDDFVVIVAGYSELMQKFINSNPGLRSRFNKYIYFPDYNVEELVSIFLNMCKEYDYVLSEDAKDAMKKIIYNMEKNKDANFANARDVRNLFERVITQQATRLSKMQTEDIMRIEVEDFK